MTWETPKYYNNSIKNSINASMPSPSGLLNRCLLFFSHLQAHLQTEQARHVLAVGHGIVGFSHTWYPKCSSLGMLGFPLNLVYFNMIKWIKWSASFTKDPSSNPKLTEPNSWGLRQWPKWSITSTSNQWGHAPCHRSKIGQPSRTKLRSTLMKLILNC